MARTCGFDGAVVVLAVLGQAVEHFDDELADQLELGFAEAARGAGRRAEANARGDGGLFGVEGHCVLVAGDMGALERLFGRLAGEALGTQIDQHQVIVGALADDIDAALDQRFGQDLGIGDNLTRRMP